MCDVVQLMLRISYFYARFLGVINFEINAETGRAKITKRATIYAAVINVVTFCVLPFVTTGELANSMWSKAGLLHEYLFLVVISMQVGCVIITIINRWLQRQSLIRIVNKFQRLAKQRPQVLVMIRHGVIRKVLLIIILEILQMTLNLVAIKGVLTIRILVSTVLVYMLIALVNVIISHYYFAMLNIRSHYSLINQELRTVLSNIQSLEMESRKASFMMKCCSLADRLEIIAKSQSELQMLVHHLAKNFGIQAFCVASNFYMTVIASIYLTFASLKDNTINDPIILMLIPIEIILYYTDILNNFRNIFSVIEQHNEMYRLLAEHSNFVPNLDERLETVLESFLLQLTSNPLKIPVLHLFYIAKYNAVAVMNSIVTNSLVLIHYEIKNG